MASTNTLSAELQNRLGDIPYTGVVWSFDELRIYIHSAIRALYPSYFQLQTATTIGQIGPMQPMPVGCRNLYMVGVKNPTSPRVRRIRGWAEGDGVCFIPKTTIEGHTVVWSWTSGFTPRTQDADIINLPPEAEEAVLLRAQAQCLNKLLIDRVAAERYFAIQVRQGVTEDDIALAVDGINAQLRLLLENTVPLPEQMR